MCDYFWQRMEGDLADLTDAVLAGRPTGPSDSPDVAADWPLPSYQSTAFLSSSGGPAYNDFSDPFVDLGEPLLRELAGVEFFDDGADSAVTHAKKVTDSSNIGCHGVDGLIPQKLLMAEEVKRRPCNIFPRAAQISPGIAKPPPFSLLAIMPSPLAAGEIMKVSSSTVTPMGPGGGVVQISSPQTPGMKRRKNQARKVVCIPALVAASNRTSGEVIPSDLWAWRKYGQKPIKGSPHPRGYYRCSSSKGCSARKQVERSRTDPNMLVITYTSEHNHPWPTQRNALAGSTRSLQPSRSPVLQKEEPKDQMISSDPPDLVKEEEASEMDTAISNSFENAEVVDQVFYQGYKSTIPEANHGDEIFADLTELDPDPMSLIFAQGPVEAKRQDRGQEEDKALDDPFDMFDYWAAHGSSFGEHNKGTP